MASARSSGSVTVLQAKLPRRVCRYASRQIPPAGAKGREVHLALGVARHVLTVALPFLPAGSDGASGICPDSLSARNSSSFSMGMALRQRGNPEQLRNGPRRLLRITIARPHLSQAHARVFRFGFFHVHAVRKRLGRLAPRVSAATHERSPSGELHVHGAAALRTRLVNLFRLHLA